MAAADGHGASITFAGMNMTLVSIDSLEISNEPIDATNMDTEDFMARIVASLNDWSMDVTVQMDADENPPVGTKSSLAIAFAGDDAPAFDGDAVLSSFNGSATTGSRMEASITFTGAGELEWDDGTE